MSYGVSELVAAMRANPRGVRFADLRKLCDRSFGEARVVGSHRIYRTGLPGRPVNIQDDRGQAKTYQVRQVLAVLDAIAAEAEQEEA